MYALLKNGEVVSTGSYAECVSTAREMGLISISSNGEYWNPDAGIIPW